MTALSFGSEGVLYSTGDDQQVKSHSADSQSLFQLSGSTAAHIIRVSQSWILLAIRENILLYSLDSNTLHSRYEGHADIVKCLNFGTQGTNFVSSAENEGFVNVWKQADCDSTSSSPFKMLEVGSWVTPNEVRMFHLEGDFYCAVAALDTSAAVFLVNLKKKKGKLVQSPDTRIQLKHSKWVQGLITIDFWPISTLVLLTGSLFWAQSHSVELFNDEGQIIKDTIEIDLNEAQSNSNGARHHDTTMLDATNASSAGYVPSTLFEGRAMAELEERLTSQALTTPKRVKQSDELSHVLSHSLQANDLETISWALSWTDVDDISTAVMNLNKNSLNSLLTHLLVKLKDGVQKSSLLWVSALLKYRWAEVLKLRKDPIYGQVLGYLDAKSKTMPRYFELKAKLDMVIQTHEVIAS